MNLEPHLDSGPLPDEEAARANFYALIGRLFFDALDADMLAEICGAGESNRAADGTDASLVRAWKELQGASRSADAGALKQEYAALFISAGKPLVSLYVSGYASGMAADKRVVRLRQQLGAWGLARREAVFEIEDHVSGLCDVMRFLIECNRPIADQKLFFDQFVYAGVLPLCDAVESAEPAVFYRQAAAFTRAFIELEKSAFEMPE